MNNMNQYIINSQDPFILQDLNINCKVGITIPEKDQNHLINDLSTIQLYINSQPIILKTNIYEISTPILLQSLQLIGAPKNTTIEIIYYK